jgi:hypothetical protein
VEDPYEVNVTYLDEELIEYSKDEAINAIEKWKSWTQNKSVPGYGKPQAQSLLPWKRREMEMQMRWKKPGSLCRVRRAFNQAKHSAQTLL